MEEVDTERPKSSAKDVISFAAIGMLFSLIDDAPFNVDHLFGAQYWVWIEVLLKVLTYSFFVLSVSRALGSHRHISWKMNLSVILAVGWANADDSSFVLGDVYPVLRGDLWYQFDITIHFISAVFLYLAIREAMKSKISE